MDSETLRFLIVWERYIAGNVGMLEYFGRFQSSEDV